ncbi:MAG TPA: iron-sulfur cluster assembly accessory protein [Arenicellales bacterium]|nr:iron-sulfur cluster assembly accessory protein [Arenicellales bacterium]
MSVRLTETAAERVQGYLKSSGAGEALRFGVKTTGCSGYAYVVDLVDRIEPDDHVFESHGVKVVVSDDALKLVDGTEIDYRKEGLNESFHFDNPRVKDTCGCGESFSV